MDFKLKVGQRLRSPGGDLIWVCEKVSPHSNTATFRINNRNHSIKVTRKEFIEYIETGALIPLEDGIDRAIKRLKNL